MAKKNPSRSKKPSVAKLKKKAWSFFSIYIRQKDADRNGINACVTCGVKAHWKKLQAGHMVAGRGNNILFDERGVAPQCYACNCCKHGNVLAYIEYLEKKLGRDTAWVIIEDLKFQSRIPRKFSVEELEELIIKYKSKIAERDLV